MCLDRPLPPLVACKRLRDHKSNTNRNRSLHACTLSRVFPREISSLTSRYTSTANSPEQTNQQLATAGTVHIHHTHTPVAAAASNSPVIRREPLLSRFGGCAGSALRCGSIRPASSTCSSIIAVLQSRLPGGIWVFKQQLFNFGLRVRRLETRPAAAQPNLLCQQHSSPFVMLHSVAGSTHAALHTPH